MMQITKQNDFAAITTPRKTLLIGWGEKTAFESPPANDKPVFYKQDFFLTNKTPWYQFSFYAEIDTPPKIDLHTHFKMDWELPDKKLFLDCVKNIFQQIETKNFEKAVAYAPAKAKQAVTGELKDYLFSNFFRSSREFNTYSYCFWDPFKGIAGAAPEELFVIKDGKLCTVACAGTVKSDQHELDHKLNLEHNLVVEEILHSLSTFSKPQKLQSAWKQAGEQLFHRITPIQAELRQTPPFNDLVQLLHPTPAIGVYPKNKGKNWLADMDHIIPRMYYGAPIGYFWRAKGEGAAYPAIRNIQWDNNTCYIYAGCGIVEGSNLDQEWEEWNAKFKAIIAAAKL